MRIYEIEDWDSGIKIRKNKWAIGRFVCYIKKHKTFMTDLGNFYHLGMTDILLDDDWELYEEPKGEELIEKKFYRVFSKSEGEFIKSYLTKEQGYISEFMHKEFPLLLPDIFITDEEVFTAYFKKDGDNLRVVKYVLASGEVIGV